MRKKRKSPDRELTKRQEAFARLMAADPEGNITRASRDAGFKGTDPVVAVTGIRLLKNAKVVALIGQLRAANIKALTNRMISSREILIRSSRIALTTIGDVLEPDGSFDFSKARERGALIGVKRIRIDHETGRVKDIEMYDSLAALNMLGNYYGLWKRGWLIDEEDPDAVICKILGISPEQLNRIKPAGLLTAGSESDYIDVDAQGEAVPSKEN